MSVNDTIGTHDVQLGLLFYDQLVRCSLTNSLILSVCAMEHELAAIKQQQMIVKPNREKGI